MRQSLFLSRNLHGKEEADNGKQPTRASRIDDRRFRHRRLAKRIRYRNYCKARANETAATLGPISGTPTRGYCVCLLRSSAMPNLLSHVRAVAASSLFATPIIAWSA